MKGVNQEKYQEYLKKTKALEYKGSKDLLLSKINKKADFIIEEIKKDYPNTFFVKSDYVITFLVVASTGISYIMFGGMWRLLALPLLILFFILRRYRWLANKKRKSFKNLKDDEQINNYRYVEGKVQYAEKGISSKILRLQMLKIFLIIISPFITVFLLEIATSSVPFDDHLVAFVASFLLSILMWNVVFYEDLQDLEYYSDTLQEDLNNARL